MLQEFWVTRTGLANRGFGLAPAISMRDLGAQPPPGVPQPPPEFPKPDIPIPGPDISPPGPTEPNIPPPLTEPPARAPRPAEAPPPSEAPDIPTPQEVPVVDPTPVSNPPLQMWRSAYAVSNTPARLN
jgi:protein TonB